MAAKTPTKIYRESCGSVTKVIAVFSGTNDIDDNDTWATGIPNITGYWCNPTDDPTTQTKEAIDVTLTTPSTGLLTFRVGEANREGVVHVEGYF